MDLLRTPVAAAMASVGCDIDDPDIAEMSFLSVRETRVGTLRSPARAGVRPGELPKSSKTAHCWGVENNEKGTNTNRIVLLRKAS